jgi:hypothetical protein
VKQAKPVKSETNVRGKNFDCMMRLRGKNADLPPSRHQALARRKLHGALLVREAACDTMEAASHCRSGLLDSSRSKVMGNSFAVFKQAALIAWASPWTLVGLCVGGCALISGGRVRRGPGILEFHGGAARWVLRAIPGGPLAMTLGHSVLGLDETSLDVAQLHELVHVRQYERWGPLFIPAYFSCWFVLWVSGKDGYRDNPFEREAYERHP